SARFDLVVGADRNVEFLLAVPVVVAHEKAATAVRIVEPAFVRRRHARAETAPRLGDLRKLRRHKNAAGDDAGGAHTHELFHCCLSSLVVFACFAFRSACSALNSASVKYTTFIQACAISSTVRSP